MKILALVTDAFGAPGGIAQYNRDLLNALANQTDIKPIEVLPRHGMIEQSPANIKQYPAIQGKLPYILKALTLSMKTKPDLIFCGHLNLLPLAWLAAKLCRAKLWLQLHGIDAWQKPGYLPCRLIEQVAFVSCVSRYTRRRFLAWANLPPCRVKILPNTVSKVSYRPRQADVKKLKQQLDIQKKTVLLTVGRLSARERYKGHDRVLRCLPQLLKRNPDLCYLIAGSGDDQERLETLAAELDIADQVKFLGKVADEQLNALYAMADLFVMPSTGEGFGIVFLEAMATGTPALGLDCDGSVDPLQDGKLGFVSNEKNLCATIQHALDTPVTSNLSQQVKTIFGQETFARHVQALVNTI